MVYNAKSAPDAKRVVTNEVRLSYVHLTTPRANRDNPSAPPKYGVTLLIPKSDLATMQRINAAINAAITEAVPTVWGGARPPQPPQPVWDGDGYRQSGELFSEECKGHWVITASSEQRPEVVDMGMNPIVDATQIYSGMFARISLRFFAYNKAGKKGIGCGLGNVQKTRDGEPLSGRSSAEDDFGDGQGYQPAGPAAGYQQQGYQQPQQQQQYQPAAPAQQYQPPQAPYQPQGPVYPQPGYQGPMQPPGGYAPAGAPQIDPLTGKPIVGNVMGLNR